MRLMRSTASRWFSGGSEMAESPMTSTLVPPLPKLMTGPNTGSRIMPIISSLPFELRYICSTVTPSIFASGTLLRDLLQQLSISAADFLPPS